jgi:hypothetical protein
MYTEEDIESAVSVGIFDAETAAAFRTHAAEQKNAIAIDEEHFQLVSGFNDIFVVIAASLLLISVGWIGKTIAPWLGGLGVSVFAWGLSEYFVRIKRMALPAIVLVCAFIGGIFSIPVGINPDYIPPAFLLAVLAAYVHWTRFKVPISVAAGTAVASGGAVLLLTATFPSLSGATPWLLCMVGMACLAYALYWDLSDPKRITRRSDVAFWLHLIAAPAIVHSVFTQFHSSAGQITNLQALSIFLLYVFICLLSILIDRRALMVSALGYVLYTFTALLKNAGLVSMSFAFTALVVGSALLILSAFWHQVRAWLVHKLPDSVQCAIAPLR